ncbi:hypothetical protein DNTS_028444 [Danionella cerebrum]|uniref:non-specific serine/threonine protein kinase n=1 Tax=Danionella cerebrum TaxID=2873325 RepID=A0A553MZQ0_9TELE|nr:hypothetical protein DNTS_028444 [Danionella translucida]
MESVGKFEFNRKDLVGHGAFAVVFKGRHKQKHNYEVAVKCINKKKIAKSQTLLGKEIKILKELKHENIVSLLDFQEISGCVYLVMEYCNGGDLAEYLHSGVMFTFTHSPLSTDSLAQHQCPLLKPKLEPDLIHLSVLYLFSKGSLSEDTIRLLLQQLAGAMSVLRSKGIVHRDLKPQNILLSYSTTRKSNPNNISIKLGELLQSTTAPEVIMSQNYDAKADLWSVGTIVYQCLTGKAPFQELRQFYERNQNLIPSIPRETSSHLRHLLLGLLQRNHKERMEFDTFFHHPFLEVSASMKKSSPVPVPTYSGSGSSSSGSSTSHLTPTQATLAASPGPHLKDSSSTDSDDFVMVPTQFTSDLVSGEGQEECTHSSFLLSVPTCVGETQSFSPAARVSPNPSRPLESCTSSYAQSVPVPVPTQKQTFQKMEHNLLVSDRAATPLHCCCPNPLPPCKRTAFSPKSGGFRLTFASPKDHRPGQVSPLFSDLSGLDPTLTHRLRAHRHSLDSIVHRWDLCRQPISNISPKTSPFQRGRNKTMSDLKDLTRCPAVGPRVPLVRPPERRDTLKRSLSAGRLSDKLLNAVLGHQLDRGSCESLNSDKPMDTAVAQCGNDGSGSPGVVFMLGSPEFRHTPPRPTRQRRFSVGAPFSSSSGWTYDHIHDVYGSPENLCYGFSDTLAMNLYEGVAFVPPELPEETLMEEVHTDLLSRLRFILAFSHCITEFAGAKDAGTEKNMCLDASFLEHSTVADQISLLSHEWSSAEQLVLYMKCAELLSSALHTAMAGIKKDRLYPSASVKLVIRELNGMYKDCVNTCRTLTEKLQLFFSSKQRLMDRMSSITAERLIYMHTIQMVQEAALDEMFHHGETSVERYHKALLLMEGLSMIITETTDLSNINKCKQCIERRLSSLQYKGYM